MRDAPVGRGRCIVPLGRYTFRSYPAYKTDFREPF